MTKAAKLDSNRAILDVLFLVPIMLSLTKSRL